MRSSTKSEILCTMLALLLTAHHVRAQEQADVAERTVDQGVERQQEYAPYPEPDSGYVTDIADLLSPQEEEQIEQWLWKVEEKTGVEMAVVTIGSIKQYRGSANSSIETG